MIKTHNTLIRRRSWYWINKELLEAKYATPPSYKDK